LEKKQQTQKKKNISLSDKGVVQEEGGRKDFFSLSFFRESKGRHQGKNPPPPLVPEGSFS
jgi:hypothetical protein